MVFGSQKDGILDESLGIEILDVESRDRWPFMATSQDAAW